MRYLLVDANHLASRCRHAMSRVDLRTSSGHRSGVVSGVIRSLSFLRNKLRIDDSRILCFWDGGRAEKRLELFPEYKSGRSKEATPEELLEKQQYYAQIDALVSGLRFAGIRQVKSSGVEADDLIAIYARTFSEAGADVLVHSGDKDMHQLCSDRIRIYHPDREELRLQDVLSEWGVSQSFLIPVFRAIVGDSSDSIPGVPGLGKKRAQMVLGLHEFLFSDCGKPAGVSDKEWRWLSQARDYRDVIARNLLLMCLPTSFENSFYSEEQVRDVIRQVRGDEMVVSMAKFLDFLRSWELNDAIENIHFWG